MTIQWNEQTAVMQERDEALERAVVEMLNAAVVLQKDSQSGSVLQCKMCGLRDEHTASCPVPALEEWINPTTLD